MDDQRTRRYIQGHADAVVRGDLEAVVSDFAEALRPRASQVVQGLPQPVRSAEILSVELSEAESVAVIRYTADSRIATIRSYWHEEGERPVIVRTEHAG